MNLASENKSRDSEKKFSLLFHFSIFNENTDHILENYEFDAFLSFAVEDKIDVANELYNKLEEHGLRIWYSGRELTLGTSIQDKIREGLDKSRFGILLISPNYFRTNWAQKELGALWARERENNKVIIPVFHNISPEEVGSWDPAIADRWSVSTAEGIDNACIKIRNHILKSEKSSRVRLNPRISGAWLISFFLFITLIAGLTLWRLLDRHLPDNRIKEEVISRINIFQSEIERDLKKLETEKEISLTDQQDVTNMIDKFSSIDSQYRNYYEFTNGFSNIQFEKNVRPASGIDFDKWSPNDNYGFKYPRIQKISNVETANNIDVKFIYFNTQPTGFDILKVQSLDSFTIVTVKYSEPIRLITFHYQYGSQTSQRKHTTHVIKGFLPTENYYFSFTDGAWILSQIN